MDTISEYGIIGYYTMSGNNIYFAVRVGNEEETFETMIIPVNLATGKIGNAVTTVNGYIRDIVYDNGYIYFKALRCNEYFELVSDNYERKKVS